MNIEDIGNSRILNLLCKPDGMVMGSRLRQWLIDPTKTVQGADIQPGQTVLVVGCGTGFFTMPAAQLIGDQGCLLAMDVLSDYIEGVSRKVQAADLRNVRVEKRDALDTRLDDASIDMVLLFGVIPFASLPLNRLLPEMHRVLKPEASMAVWLFPISFGVPEAILRSELFTYISKRNGVYNYKRC
jgi:demethylmenaquinone methyltransferase/2-methoxy-6-polyprenyl-1,4-benzoquinol methylase